MRPILMLMFAVSATSAGLHAAEPIVVRLWPEEPPGYQVTTGPERDTSEPDSGDVAGRAVIRLGHVSTPELHVFKPSHENANGATVVVCPGGGFHILAWDLEGTEVAEWLNSIGVTAAVLKYRVPTAASEPNWLPPAQDAQRAVRLVRSHAAEWEVDPNRVGLLGFSAGGRAAAMAALKSEERLYEPIDEADRQSARADFLTLVYTAYLVDEDGALKPEVAVTKESPPAFFVHAADDPVTPVSSVRLFLELKKAGVPAELHVYESGGHGYGLRPTAAPVTGWPSRYEEWMRSRGTLDVRTTQ